MSPLAQETCSAAILPRLSRVSTELPTAFVMCKCWNGKKTNTQPIPAKQKALQQQLGKKPNQLALYNTTKNCPLAKWFFYAGLVSWMSFRLVFQDCSQMIKLFLSLTQFLNKLLFEWKQQITICISCWRRMPVNKHCIEWSWRLQDTNTDIKGWKMRKKCR